MLIKDPEAMETMAPKIKTKMETKQTDFKMMLLRCTLFKSRALISRTQVRMMMTNLRREQTLASLEPWQLRLGNHPVKNSKESVAPVRLCKFLKNLMPS